jgi:hypothetical protein
MAQQLPSDDRRQHPRYKFVKPMQVIVAKRPVKGFTCDLGEGGMSFIVDTILSNGAVTVEVPEVNFTVEGRVIGNQPTAEAGLHRHQMQFKDPLLTATLEELLT